MRVTPESVRAASNAQDSSAQWFILLEISHTYAGVNSPIRITDNPSGVIYNGNDYLFFPFSIDLPDVKEKETANGRITLGASGELVEVIRGVSTPATMRAVAVCLPGSVIEPVASFDLTIRNVSGTLETVSAELVFEERMKNEIPCDDCTPYLFPGL